MVFIGLFHILAQKVKAWRENYEFKETNSKILRSVVSEVLSFMGSSVDLIFLIVCFMSHQRINRSGQIFVLRLTRPKEG